MGSSMGAARRQPPWFRWARVGGGSGIDGKDEGRGVGGPGTLPSPSPPLFPISRPLGGSHMDSLGRGKPLGALPPGGVAGADREGIGGRGAGPEAQGGGDQRPQARTQGARDGLGAAGGGAGRGYPHPPPSLVRGTGPRCRPAGDPDGDGDQRQEAAGRPWRIGGAGGATTTIDRGDWRWGERTPGPSLRIPGPAWYAMRSPFSHGPPLSLRHHIDGNTGGGLPFLSRLIKSWILITSTHLGDTAADNSHICEHLEQCSIHSIERSVFLFHFVSPSQK